MVALVRVDDRLIHGQVTAVWCRAWNLDRIIVVDDEVAADPFMQEVYRLAAPAGIQVQVVSLEDAVPLLRQEAEDGGHRTMVLLRSVAGAVALYEQGFSFPALNVGGIGMGPGRRPLWRNIAASPQEIALLERLAQRGVEVTLQPVPDDRPVPLADLVG